MPNKKSAAKRDMIAEKNRMYNRYWKTRCKTTAKNFIAAVGGSDKDLVSARLSEATSALDKAVTKGVIHRNTAARRKSRMAVLANPILKTEQHRGVSSFAFLFYTAFGVGARIARPLPSIAARKADARCAPLH